MSEQTFRKPESDGHYEAFLAEHFPEGDGALDAYYAAKFEAIRAGAPTLMVRNHDADQGVCLDYFVHGQRAAFVDVDVSGAVELYKVDDMSPPAFIDSYDSPSQNDNIMAALGELGLYQDSN